MMIEQVELCSEVCARLRIAGLLADRSHRDQICATNACGAKDVKRFCSPLFPTKQLRNAEFQDDLGEIGEMNEKNAVILL